MPTLETERLVLRRLAPDDASHLAALFAGDPEAVGHAGNMPYPPDEAAMREWIARLLAPGACGFLIVRRGDGAVLGAAGFGGNGGRVELGYALGRLYRGRGFTTEAVRALIGLVQELGLEAVDAYSFTDNPGSARVLEKAGFSDLGVTTRDCPQDGGTRAVRHFCKTFGR
jgi:[ribosomal protein S5]-alanine N-acetyltransferase